MKLKKLLPLAGLTGIAAVAAPLVTSCAQKGTAITWELGDDEIVLESLEDGVDFKNETKMLEGYLSAIENDRTIMSKDIVKSVCNKFNPTANDEQLTSVSIRTDKIDVAKHLVSIHGSVEVKTSTDGGKPSLLTTEWTMKNMEYVCQHTENDKTTQFIPKLFSLTVGQQDWIDYIIELSKDSKWSFEIKQTTSLGTTVEVKLNHANIGDLSPQWEKFLLESAYDMTGILYVSTYYAKASITE